MNYFSLPDFTLKIKGCVNYKINCERGKNLAVTMSITHFLFIQIPTPAKKLTYIYFLNAKIDFL